MEGTEIDYHKICQDMSVEALTLLEFRVEQNIRLEKTKLKTIKYWRKKKLK